ncbi:MAG: hypothetical protein H6700_07195 [Myxococcales bacterium]|nr:hypothetical protein [Myxococcales bacterium]MCB9531534.1 hypothetical protein [Myxococcales bacterium]
MRAGRSAAAVVALMVGACGSAPEVGYVTGGDTGELSTDADGHIDAADVGDELVADARPPDDVADGDVSIDASDTRPDTPDLGVDDVARDAPDPCATSPEEPNDSAAAATGLDVGATLNGRICANDLDWFGVELAAGESVSIAIRFTHRRGDLDAALYRAGDLTNPVMVADSGDDDELLSFGPATEATRLLVYLYGFEGAENTYTIAATTQQVPGTVATVRGVVTFDDRLFGPDGFTGEIASRPIRSGVVEVADETGTVIATTSTDDAGNFAADYVAEPGVAITVRALAAVTVDGLRVEVRDRSRSSALYSISGRTVAGAAELVTLHGAAETSAGPALHIADVVGDAFRFTRRFSDASAPTLRVSWQDGQPFSCGSCYSNQTISLGGQVEDPDQYDDDIILHEVGHYLVQHFGADSSPGGSHRDRLVSPQLAYGEGLAYFLSSAIREDPTMTDNFEASARFIDYEAVTLGGESIDDFFGTTNGRLNGDLREEVVAGVMWDVYDGPSAAEPFDAISLGPDATMAILFDYFHAGTAANVGPSGIDLSDFLNAVGCGFPEQGDALQLVVDDREFPWSVGDDTECSLKGDGFGRPEPTQAQLDAAARSEGRLVACGGDLCRDTTPR